MAVDRVVFESINSHTCKEKSLSRECNIVSSHDKMILMTHESAVLAIFVCRLILTYLRVLAGTETLIEYACMSKRACNT